MRPSSLRVVMSASPTTKPSRFKFNKNPRNFPLEKVFLLTHGSLSFSDHNQIFSKVNLQKLFFL